MKRKNSQPRNISGRFTNSTPIGVEDIRGALVPFRECLLPPENPSFGRRNGSSWEIRRGKRTTILAHEILFERSNNLSLKGRKLAKKCKTVGCCNPKHYGLSSDLDKLLHTYDGEL